MKNTSSVLLLMIMVTFFVISCGPASKIKKAERLIEQAIAKGAKVDSTKYIVYDTLFVKAFRDAFKTTIDVDPTFILEKCQEIIAAKPEARRPIIVEVQDKICPDVAVDTTYRMHIDAPEGLYEVPVHVLINAKGGKADFSIEAKEVIIPVRSETNKIEISAGYTLWQLIILAIICLVLGYGVRALTKG